MVERTAVNRLVVGSNPTRGALYFQKHGFMEGQRIKSSESNKSTKSLKIKVLEPFAFIIWLFAFIKLFVFDWDTKLIYAILPSQTWILDFKILIYLVIICTFLVITQKDVFIKGLLFTIFYPFILICFEIPLFIILQGKGGWNIVFLIINFVISFFRKFKLKFVLTTLYLVSAFIVLSKIENTYLISISIILVFLILLLVLVFELLNIFKAPNIFTIYPKITNWVTEKAIPHLTPKDDLKSIPIEKLDSKQIEQRNSNFQFTVLLNRIYLFCAKKLSLFYKSKLTLCPILLEFFFTIIFMIITFAIINYGLFKIDPHSFDIATDPLFFNFLYYSLLQLIHNSTPDLIPSSILAKILSMSEIVSGILILVITAGQLITIKKFKYENELNKSISDLKLQSDKIESLIITEYHIDSIGEAMKELEKCKTSIVNLLYKITESLE